MKLRRDRPSGAFLCREEAEPFKVQGKRLCISQCRESGCGFRKERKTAWVFPVPENKLLTDKSIKGTLVAQADFMEKVM